MKQMWRPWRSEYVTSASEKSEACIFCSKPLLGKDFETGILHRGKSAFAMLNKYPYNNGHIMIAPYRHEGAFQNLSEEEVHEIMRIAGDVIEAIDSAMNPQGYNVGFNIGKAAGAGFDEHIHMHIVPRWFGDTNFMPVIADTKVIPESLSSVYEKLLSAMEDNE